MKDDVLSHIKSEFALWGIKPRVEYTNGGHIELAWNATPDKPERRTFIPKTGSDWRGWLNQRAQVRRMLKQDGLVLKEEIRKPKPAAIVKALAVPEHVETDADQIKLLRAEVSDLSEMILMMNKTLRELIAVTPPTEVPEFIPPPPPPAPIRKPSVRSIKAIDVVGVNWSSTDALARDMGLDPVIAYRKLNYLMKKDLIELSGGRWRKKPEVPVPEPVVIAQTKKPRALNGHRKH